ncbi:MAG: peptide ABC transporter substrate-binding protein [Oscillospiraceae bacterium]|nr:peptide ABC transporter substrate-binding protein [Oscillospiraceae bacterium]
MKKLKRIIALLLCAATVLAFAACGKTTENGPAGSTTAPADSGGAGGTPSGEAPAAEKKIIRIRDTGMLGSLDPAGDASGMYTSFAMYGLCYLVNFNDLGEMTYEAAESYETNADQTVWTFHLRPEGKWSDGSPVIADDFINTLRNTLTPGSGSAHMTELFVIKGARETQPAEGQEFDPSTLDNLGVKAIDDFTLEFTLNAPCPYFLKLTTVFTFAPSKSGVATRENKTWYTNPDTYLCNGPYYLAEFVQDERYVLKKNQYFYDADKVKIDTIEFIVIPDSMAAAAAYETGELDYASSLLDTSFQQYAGMPDLVGWTVPTTVFLQYNFEKAPAFNDIRVREAVSLAINRQDVCTSLGDGFTPNYNFVAPSMSSNDDTSGKVWVDERPQLFSEDLEKAKQLLADAGYPNGEGFPVYTYVYRNSTSSPDVAVALQAQLKANLGINIELQGVEIGVFYAMRRDADYELLGNSWTAVTMEPITFLEVFMTGGGFASNAHISDATYDELVKKSNIELVPATRNAQMHDADKYLVAEQFYIAPILTQEIFSLRNPKITGVEKTANGSSCFRFADIEG